MKFFYKIFFLVVTVLLLSGCKKGEDDPLLSFKSRKTRLEGKWRMIEGGVRYSEPGYIEYYTFKGDRYDVEVSTKRFYWLYTGIYSLTLNIDKNGLFESGEVFDKNVINCDGTWSFNSGVGETKSKENVSFFVNKINEGFTGLHFFNRFKGVFVYSITELRDKKLVIRSEGKVYSSLSGNYATLISYYTFEQ